MFAAKDLLCANQAVFVLIATILWMLIPRLTRRDIWFAVTVSPGFRDTPQARAIVGQYRLIAGVGGIAALALVAAGWFAERPVLGLFGPLLQMVLAVPAFQIARRRTLPHAVVPSTIREVALSRPAASSTVSALWHVGPLAILLAAGSRVYSKWGQIPAVIPLHWNGSGQVDRVGPKSLSLAFSPLLAGACVCLMLWLTGWAVGRARHVNASGVAAANEQRFRRSIRGMIVGGEYLVAITFALTMVPTSGGPVWPVYVSPFLAIVYVVVLVAVLSRVGQGGSRLAAQPSGTAVGDRTPDDCWKWGMFYVNPDDPAVFVEKRFGIGYTLNFGHVGSWLLLGGTLLVPIVLGILIRKGVR